MKQNASQQEQSGNRETEIAKKENRTDETAETLRMEGKMAKRKAEEWK
jgi:hypothetical protein